MADSCFTLAAARERVIANAQRRTLPQRPQGATPVPPLRAQPTGERVLGVDLHGAMRTERLTFFISDKTAISPSMRSNAQGLLSGDRTRKAKQVVKLGCGKHLGAMYDDFYR